MLKFGWAVQSAHRPTIHLNSSTFITDTFTHNSLKPQPQHSVHPKWYSTTKPRPKKKWFGVPRVQHSCQILKYTTPKSTRLELLSLLLAWAQIRVKSDAEASYPYSVISATSRTIPKESLPITVGAKTFANLRSSKNHRRRNDASVLFDAACDIRHIFQVSVVVWKLATLEWSKNPKKVISNLH